MKNSKQTKQKTVLITGASSGIGTSFAKVFAEHGYDLFLTGRSEEKLKDIARELKAQHNIKVNYLSLDLASPQAGKKLFEWVTSLSPHLTCLVNNAGMGNYGEFSTVSLEKERELLEVNIGVLTELCHRFIPLMKEQGGGYILNVASMASFQPGSYYATYYASKAYVLLFTESLALEHRHDNIVISALCPGPSPTQFFERAQMASTAPLLRYSMLPPDAVARAGFDGLMKRKTVIIPSKKYLLIPLGSRLFPRTITAKISKKFIEIAAKG